MAETAGFVLAVGSIAGIFTSCVDCFEYIQLGRKFGRDFESSLLKLSAAELQLTRWGASVGLYANDSGDMTLPSKLGIEASSREIRQAERTLGAILALVNEAKKKSETYSTSSGVKSEDLTMIDPETSSQTYEKDLLKGMRRIIISRQKRTSARNKTKWALYDRKHFTELIQEVTDHVDNLVRLFPATVEPQKKLCYAEISVISQDSGPQSLELLQDTVKDFDPLLSDVVKKALEVNNGHFVHGTHISDKAEVLIGDYHAVGFQRSVNASSHTVINTRAMGESKTHIGDSFGGKSVFDD